MTPTIFSLPPSLPLSLSVAADFSPLVDNIYIFQARQSYASKIVNVTNRDCQKPPKQAHYCHVIFNSNHFANSTTNYVSEKQLGLEYNWFNASGNRSILN